jgi:phosphohistidine swiveling domain-containing protein
VNARYSQFSCCTDLSAAVNVLQVGGKAANLSRAATLGMRIPKGFVVTRNALTHFLEINAFMAPVKNLIERDWENSGDQRRRYDSLCSMVLATPISEEITAEVELFAKKLLVSAQAGLAVRSSGIHEDTAAASFAGVFKSFVGISTLEALWDKICLCWCSAWTPQAVSYARRKGLEIAPDHMAVLVQEVIPADSAGVIFTADPLTGNPWHFVLNSTWGLAQRIVDGESPADRFVLEWDTGHILKRHVAEKPAALISDATGVKEVALPDDKSATASLSDAMIAQIGQLALHLDRAFDQRVDIEWAVSGGELYLVQVRPIVALPCFFPHELSAKDAKLTWMPLEPVWYAQAEEGKALVAPFFHDRWALELWHRNLVPGDIFPRRVGYERDFNGYRYGAEWGWATGRDDREWIEHWLAENEAGLEHAWLAQKARVIDTSRHITEVLQSTTGSRDLIALLLECYRCEDDMQAAVWAAPQWMVFTCEYLLKPLIEDIAPGFAYEKLLQGLPSYSHERTKAAQALGRSIDEERVRDIFLRKSPETILPALLEHCPNSRFLKDYIAFCWQFGICPPHLSRPWSLWSQDPTPILFIIKNVLLGQSQDAGEVLEKCVAERKAQEEILRQKTTHCDPALQRRLDHILTWTYFWTPVLDDRSWHYVISTRLVDLLRQTGTALVEEGLLDTINDILLLTVDDLVEIAKADDVRCCRELYLTRKREYERNRRLTPPPFLGMPPDPAPEEQSTDRYAQHIVFAKGAFHGEGFSPGQAIGLSRKIESLNDPALLSSLTSEHILVCPKAGEWRPDWLSLFMVVKGLITVRGVQLQHATQIARECGIPFVNLPEEDWDNIPDNVRLAIDGEAGLVTIVE